MYAMAEARELPAVLARVHARYRTPYVAVVVSAVLIWALSVSSGFAAMAALSAIARLLAYMVTCAALPVLRRKMPDAQRRFSVPGGAAIPAAALAMSVWLLFGSTREQVLVSAVALLAGAAVYGGYRWGIRKTAL